MNSTKITHLLLGAAVLLAFPLIYLGMLRPGQIMLSPSQWLIFGGVASALVLGAFLPGVVRRVRGLPQQQVAPSDLRFAVALAVIFCPLAFFAVWFFGAFGTLVIALAPFPWLFRGPQRVRQPVRK